METRNILKTIVAIFITLILINACNKDDILETKREGFLYGIKHGDYFGYINSKGEIVLDSLDDGIIGEISGNFACNNIDYYEPVVGSLPNHVLEWKWYYRDGSVLNMSRDYIPVNDQWLGPFIKENHKYIFYDNRAIVAKSGGGYGYLLGFVDENGNEVIPCQHNWVSDFNDGIAAVLDPATNKVGYIDKQGNYIIEPQYELSYYAGPYSFGFYNGKAVVSKEGVYYVIDKDNNILADFGDLKGEYQNFKPSNKVSEDLLRFDVDGGTGFANMSGEWEIEPELKYYRVGDFVNGLAIVKIDSLPSYSYAYIDKTGNRVFSGAYGTASEFDENGLAWVTSTYFTTAEALSRDGMFIDKTGNRAFPGEFSGVYNCRFVNELALVYDLTQEVWKYINTSGETMFISSIEPMTNKYFGDPTKHNVKLLNGHFNSEGVALIGYTYINTTGEILYSSRGSIDNLLRTEFWYD